MIVRDNTTLAPALDAIDQAAGPQSSQEKAMARGLMRGYDARWRDQEEQPLVVEEEFECSIYNLTAKRTSASRTFTLAGIKDVIVSRRAKRFVMDHKTTGDKISDPDGTFWRQLTIESQVDAYLLSEHYQGRSVDGAIWDVIHKPGIRPKKLTKADQKAVTSLGTYCGFDVSNQAPQHVIKEGREDFELYEYRIARDCLDHPGEYYQRKPVFRLPNELAAYADELWALTKAVVAARRYANQPDRLPLRHSGACMNYGRACEYLGICSGCDTPESNKWRHRAQIHEELHCVRGDGHNVLTNSRLKCFQLCQRKHYYRYELGIERVDRETSAALYFGTIMHKGLECWWSRFLPTNKET